MTVWDTSGNERNRYLSNIYCKNIDIIIVVFDLSKPDSIDKNLFTEIKKQSKPKQSLIYLVGNKLDIFNGYLKEYRKKALMLIDAGIIDKYFEVSAKTGEGFEEFSKILKIDAANYSQLFDRNKKQFFEKMKQLNVKNLKFKKLSKYFNI